MFCRFVDPFGQVVPCEMSGNNSGGWTVRWTPHELGVHSIDVQYGRSVVVGSPFKCKVFDLSKVVILRDQHLDLLDHSDDVIFYGTSCCLVLFSFSQSLIYGNSFLDQELIP